MQSHVNTDLAAILTKASSLQARENSSFNDPNDAIKYAVLSRIEDSIGLPVLVKYGDASAVCAEYGREGNEAWEIADCPDSTLFYVEPTEELHIEAEKTLRAQFAAIGASYIGSTGAGQHGSWLHYLFLWPDDSPLLEKFPEQPEKPER